MGSITVGFDFTCGSWSDSRGSWSDGPIFEGGGSDGPMVGYFGPMGMGYGFNGTMVVVLVLVGRGSSIY